MSETTTIQIHKTTRKDLGKIKNGEEDFNGTIERLIKNEVKIQNSLSVIKEIQPIQEDT